MAQSEPQPCCLSRPPVWGNQQLRNASDVGWAKRGAAERLHKLLRAEVPDLRSEATSQQRRAKPIAGGGACPASAVGRQLCINRNVNSNSAKRDRQMAGMSISQKSGRRASTDRQVTAHFYLSMTTVTAMRPPIMMTAYPAQMPAPVPVSATHAVAMASAYLQDHRIGLAGNHL